MLIALSDYEKEGTEVAPVIAHTFVHYNTSCVVGWSPLELSSDG